MRDPKIQKSYWLLGIGLTLTGFLIPVYFFMIMAFPILGSVMPVLILLSYMLIWLIVVFSQYNKFDILYGIYRDWKKTGDEAKKEALGDITFKGIRKLKEFKQERKEKIRIGQVEGGFELIRNGSLGCVFYSNGEIHTYTYIVIIGTSDLITIPLMFTKSLSSVFSAVDTVHVKKEFSNWINENGYRMEHLLLYKRGSAYDPDQEL